jgi:hypothetical protein
MSRGELGRVLVVCGERVETGLELVPEELHILGHVLVRPLPGREILDEGEELRHEHRRQVLCGGFGYKILLGVGDSLC